MATAAGGGDGIHFIFDSCLSGCDCDISRRPYHRNCGCALHNSRSRGCLLRKEKSDIVAFPIRRSWSEGSLALQAFSNPNSVHSSPASNNSVEIGGRRRKGSVNRLMELGTEEEDEKGET